MQSNRHARQTRRASRRHALRTFATMTATMTVAMTAAVTVASAPVGAFAGPPRTAAPRVGCAPPADFDCDGLADIAIGAPGEYNGRGLVTVSAPDNRRFGQDVPGVLGAAQPLEGFGSALAIGDFNGDGYSDLAAGVPGDVVAGHPGAGGVNVLYGSASGLSVIGDQYFTQDSPGVFFAAQDDAFFGGTLAAGDFDGDGDADLAVGAPGQIVGAAPAAGSVQVLLGGATGLRPGRGYSELTQGVIGQPRPGDAFGFALAAGRFGGDAAADLAVGTPGAFVSGRAAAGAVTVLTGRAGTGLSPWSQQWTEANIQAAGSGGPQLEDGFGWAVAAGDLNRDGLADLAVGAPGERSGGVAFAGAVYVLSATAGGLQSGATLLSQETPGVFGTSNPNQEFGASLLIAAVDDDGGPQNALVIGVPYENVGGVSESGRVQVLRTTPSGVTGAGSQTLDLATPGVCSCGPTPSGWFGISLAASDAFGTGVLSLIVGSPGEDVGAAIAAGAATIFLGDSNPGAGLDLVTAGAEHLTQDSPGVPGDPGNGDYFAGALAP